MDKGEQRERSKEYLLIPGRNKHSLLKMETVLESGQKRTQRIQEKVLEPPMIEKSD